MAEDQWPQNGPDRLEDICLRFLAKNLPLIAQQGKGPSPSPAKTHDHGVSCLSNANKWNIINATTAAAAGGAFCVGDIDRGCHNHHHHGGGSSSSSVDPEVTTCLHIRPGVFLPRSLCDRLLSLLLEEGEEGDVTYERLSLFSDRQATRLSRLNLRRVATQSLKRGLSMLRDQPLTDLVTPCVWAALPLLASFSTLRSLRLEREPLKHQDKDEVSVLRDIFDSYRGGGGGGGGGDETLEYDDDVVSGDGCNNGNTVFDGGDFSVKSENESVDSSLSNGAASLLFKPKEGGGGGSGSGGWGGGWGGGVGSVCPPHLHRLTLHNLQFYNAPDALSEASNSRLVAALLRPLGHLRHLSLGLCRLSLRHLEACLSGLTDLLSLGLANIPVEDFPALLRTLKPLGKLQHLDLSQGREEVSPVMYPDSGAVLKQLMDTLPCLVSIDISGTNLAGFEPPTTVSHRMTAKAQKKAQEGGSEGGSTCRELEGGSSCPIPGLEGRHLEFLGLYNCAYSACGRQHIPATRVTGDATWEQTVLAVQVYGDNPVILIRALNDLFNLFRNATVGDHRQALEGVLSAMKAYPKDSSIQIAGSASLFYIAKGDAKQFITYQHKRELVNLLLSAMYEHCYDATMMRNACLTLCHLNLPGDVMFCYERLVRQLLDLLEYNNYRDDFIHRLGIFLLNCLACQVDGKEKEMVGKMGAVETMLKIIAHKLQNKVCDDVLEVAWSTLWNVTDETPANCQKFLNKNGMQLFVSCLQSFEDKPELLRNMMGLMGNIAEVDHLRKHLMVDEFVQIFSDLLVSESDGIEVSYNACGVLSHLCFNGAEAWTVDSPPRQEVLARMKTAIQRWPLRSKRNINYKSFEPILRLVDHYDTPIVQHWACWALCNLTTVSPDKYCRLLERERGRAVLARVAADARPDPSVRRLARQTLQRLDSFTPGSRRNSSEDVFIFQEDEEEEGVEEDGEEVEGMVEDEEEEEEGGGGREMEDNEEDLEEEEEEVVMEEQH